MEKYYICETASRSGISRYAEDFYRLVLAPLSYEHLPPTKLETSKLQTISPGATFHLELGASQHLERKALVALFRLGFRNITVTLHDPPFITFPSFRFENPLLARLSRGFDWYLNAFGLNRHLLRKCKNICVLSRHGRHLLESRYGITNVHFIPHIIDPRQVEDATHATVSKDILFYGFIGARKGLNYALSMHAEIAKRYPGIHLHVVGEAMTAPAAAYLASLKARYTSGVTFHGYVATDRLDALFQKVEHVILPFHPYKYVCSVSGSVLTSLRHNKIVWTTPTSAIPEIIDDQETGMFLTMNLKSDVERFLCLYANRSEILRIRKNISTKLADFCPAQILPIIQRIG